MHKHKPLYIPDIVNKKHVDNFQFKFFGLILLKMAENDFFGKNWIDILDIKHVLPLWLK